MPAHFRVLLETFLLCLFMGGVAYYHYISGNRKTSIFAAIVSFLCLVAFILACTW